MNKYLPRVVNGFLFRENGWMCRHDLNLGSLKD